jgi:hypothetical protein
MQQPQTKMLIERRFPVRLGLQVASLESAYREEKSANWNPVADIPWDLLGADGLEQRDRDAARLMWSRRLWAAYGYLSETPATLIRLCLELDRPISPKFFLTVRNTQEACHIDVMQKFAEAYGGFISKPASSAYAVALNLDLARRVLHADTNIDAYILAHCAIKIGAEAALYKLFETTVKNTAIATALGLIAGDKRRHAEFGWNFIMDQIHAWDADDRAAAEAEIVRTVNDVIFSGYLTPFLAASGVADEEKAAEELAAAAGLGSAVETRQRGILAAYLGETRERLRGLSIELPELNAV